MKKIIGVMAVAMLLAGLLVLPASANQGQAETCKHTLDYPENLSESSSGEWGSATWHADGTDGTVTLQVNEGYEVTICIKKGSSQSQEDGPLRESAHTGPTTVTIDWDGDPFSHYGIKFEVLPDPEPELVTVTAVKNWDGDGFDDSDLEVTFTLSVEGEADVILNPGQESEPFEEGKSYTLTENVAGFPDDVCSWENTARSSSISLNPDGPDAISETFTNTVECEEEEEPETQTISFTKIWDGDDFEGSDDVVVTFDVLIDGEEVTLADGEESEEFDADAEWSFVGENVTGFPDEVCEYEADVSEEEGTVTNTVVCAEVEDTPPLEQPPGEEPEVERVSVEKKVETKTEVLAASATLPRTGVPALVLALLGLLAIGSGGAILRRR